MIDDLLSPSSSRSLREVSGDTSNLRVGLEAQFHPPVSIPPLRAGFIFPLWCWYSTFDAKGCAVGAWHAETGSVAADLTHVRRAFGHSDAQDGRRRSGVTYFARVARLSQNWRVSFQYFHCAASAPRLKRLFSEASNSPRKLWTHVACSRADCMSAPQSIQAHAATRNCSTHLLKLWCVEDGVLLGPAGLGLTLVAMKALLSVAAMLSRWRASRG